MRVRVYEEGRDSTAREYDLLPLSAAIQFADDVGDDMLDSNRVNVVPLDEEAKALAGWLSDDDDPQFKIFDVYPSTTWDAVERTGSGPCGR